MNRRWDASESHDFTYTVTANSPDPVPNEVTATGTGVTSEDVVRDSSANCSTDILNPDILWSRKTCTAFCAGRRCDHLHDHRGPTPATRTLEGHHGRTTRLFGRPLQTPADELAVDASESHDFTYTVTA